MTAPGLDQAAHSAIKAAMGVARDVAEGLVSPAELDQVAAEECRSLFGTVIGPDDPLWDLQGNVCRQVLSMGGVDARELAEWLAVARIYGRGVTTQSVGETWMDRVLQSLAEAEGEESDDA